MKHHTSNPITSTLSILAVVLSMLIGANALHAADLTWDITSGDGATITGGIGTWANGTGNWNTGAGDTIWSNTTPDAAIFGGTAGTITLGSAVTVGNMTFNLGGTGNYAIAGGGNTLTLNNSTITTNKEASISATIAGTTGLIKAGTDGLTLSGTNTYSGGTTINAGVIQVGFQNDSALGTGAVTVNSGGTLKLNRNTITNSLTLNGGTLQGSNGFGETWSGTIDLAATSTMTSPFNMTWSNTVSGAGGLNKAGSGTLLLSGTNTYTGTTISGGTLQVPTGGSITHPAALLNVGNSSGDIGALNITGGTVSAGTGNIGNSAGSSGTATVSIGSLSLTNRLRVGLSGTGVLNLTGSGVVQVGGAGVLNLGVAATATGTLNLGTGDVAGTLDAATVTGGSGTAVVNFNQTGNYSFAPNLRGSLAMNKLGAGTTTLSADNTYTGGSTITGGTLNVTNTTGSATGTGNVTVDATGTLSGTGSIATASNNFIYLNGTLIIGDSTLGSAVASHLTLTTSGTGSALLVASSVLNLDLFQRGGDLTSSITAADYLALYGALDSTLGGTLVLGNPNVMNGFAVGDKWKLFDLSGGGTISTALALDYSALSLGVGLGGSFDITTGVFSIAAVPEPSRALLLLGGLSGVLMRRRRSAK